MEDVTAPQENERKVPPYVALVRIGTVLGMSAALAFGLFILLLGTRYWHIGLISIALAIPFFVVMRLIENTAKPPETNR